MPEIDLTGTTLGKYQVHKTIGRGGMGTVYAGYDAALDRPVAIKVLASHLAWEETFVERFMREARTAAKLDHPNIVTIYDVGQQDGTYYLVMRQIEGEPLRDIIARTGPLPPARAARILGQVAGALDYAHSRGVVHRDVKPGNMLVEAGDRVTLTDFGIARAAEGTRLTATGISLGTPEYMSPEQALGQPTDSRTDVYSLGIVLYEMLTGQVPFHADTPIATLMQPAHTPPPSPRTVVSSLSTEIETVVLKALAKRSEDRYASAGELARTMDTLVTQDRAAQLCRQVAEARSWIAWGQYDRAIERLEALARAHPGDPQIAAGLAEAREQARLAGVYTEVQQLWGQAQAKADQILTAAPGYA
ncbi:MAG: serine/threonine-protein kinase [Anaerolineae bacterium]